MRKVLASFLALLIVGCASGRVAAGPDRAVFLLGSEHVGATRDFEEFNPGVVLIWENALWQKRLDFAAGAFRNSYGGGSAVMSAGLPIVRSSPWGLDLFGGLAWYPGHGEEIRVSVGDVVPIAGIQARYRFLVAQVIPASGAGMDGLVSFGLSIPLSRRAEPGQPELETRRQGD